MEIISLNQGTFSVGKDKKFEKIVNKTVVNAHEKLILNIQPFLIKQATNRYILLDAGLSMSTLKEGTPDIIQLLANCNLDPNDIDMVLISHLHQDHFSGIFHHKTQDLLFPNASLYIYKEDILNCIGAERYPQYTNALKQLLNLPNTHLLTSTSGNINHTIKFLHTGGHMPYHIVYQIENNNQVIFYGGDEAPQLRQMKMNMVAKYDFDGKKAAMLRKEWWEKGRQEKWIFLFYHENEEAIVYMTSHTS